MSEGGGKFCWSVTDEQKRVLWRGNQEMRSQSADGILDHVGQALGDAHPEEVADVDEEHADGVGGNGETAPDDAAFCNKV